ncbi:hypothetical protein CSF_1779 [Campylobacter sputorum bv. faecalis CCUG 20703]|nr:hypothetical protein CSPUT_1767 [Campylobacter sputorum aubsp. sputorum RM3237]ASM37606.1 hypothetical protein CSF_1779 [Campylobacter sputorum bv. faecalis CCUG 20703]ASM39270.1 hypothetical protein CSPARA_1744 [Campylobacter sputorum bv. paraureolyticus LMG 11764]QEL06112.1 hypothetical protein CSPT_1762 [Campylobacter sputorum subsp. sputorum]
MSFVLGILTITFGFLNFNHKNYFIAGCMVLALYLMLFSNNKFYSFVYYFFALGLTQLFFTAYTTIKGKL